MATVVTSQTFDKKEDLQARLNKIFGKKYNDTYAGIAAGGVLMGELEELEYDNIVSFTKEFRDLDMTITVEVVGEKAHGLTVAYEI